MVFEFWSWELAWMDRMGKMLGWWFSGIPCVPPTSLPFLGRAAKGSDVGGGSDVRNGGEGMGRCGGGGVG